MEVAEVAMVEGEDKPLLELVVESALALDRDQSSRKLSGMRGQTS